MHQHYQIGGITFESTFVYVKEIDFTDYQLIADYLKHKIFVGGKISFPGDDNDLVILGFIN